MVKKVKGSHRLDKYYHLAKEQGYRSRAAFKLIQLNRKYNLLNNCRAVLDLCAAPGGWLQVVANALPLSSLIVGVDLAPIKPIRGVKTFVADITTQKCRQLVKKEVAGGMFDVVLHDGAPNVGGAWTSEAYTQAVLALEALKLATDTLVPKGTFVTKVFRSKDYNALLYALGQLFDKVEATKPAASRNASAEIFVVCLGYKAPAKIDPRLLDPRHLFQEVNEVKKVMGPDALLRQQLKQRRQRDGYEEGLSTTHRPASALAFALSSSPVEMLGAYTSLLLDGSGAEGLQGLDEEAQGGMQGIDLKGAADSVRSHPGTTTEIRALCKDLKVLGRSEFKQLLKWRLALRKALKEPLGLEDEVKGGKGAKGKKGAAAGAAAGKVAAAAAAGGEAEGEVTAEQAEEKLLAEMQEVRERLAHDAKKSKKKRREMKMKARVRAATMTQSQGILEDAQTGEEALFSLAALPEDAKRLKKLSDARALDENTMEDIDASSDEGAVSEGSDDSEEDELAYEAELEGALDEAYRTYLERKGVRDTAAAEKRRRLGMDGELDSDDAADAADVDEDVEADDSDDEDVLHGAAARRRAPGAGLLVELDEERAGNAKSKSAMAAQWFKQDLFADANLMDDEEEDAPSTSQPPASRKQARSGAAPADDDAPPAKKARGKAQPIGPEDDGDAAAAGKRSKRKHAGEDGANGNGTGPLAQDGADSASEEEGGKKPRSRTRQHASSDKDKDGFEVVPQDVDNSGSGSGTDSEDEYDMLDANGKAEVLALARKMLRRKDKESIVDAAYCRYAFHDTAGMPRWFTEDENRHMRPIAPVTRDEVEAEKDRLRAIDARPIKKIAEAKGRKQRRMVAKLTKARQKANQLAEQEDVPAKTRVREIEKIYAQARASGKKGKGKDKRKGPPLDKRMLADKRGTDKMKRLQKKNHGRMKVAGGGKGKGKAGGKAGGRSGGKR